MDVISYTLSKKYTDEKCKDMEDKRQQDKLKVTKVEKELNDFKNTLQQVNVNQEAKQSTSGYGIISLPKNAANGQVSSADIQGLTATNLIQNGDFSKGLIGIAPNSGMSASINANGNLVATTILDDRNGTVSLIVPSPRIINHIYFMIAKVRSNNPNMRIGFYDLVTGEFAETTGDMTWQIVTARYSRASESPRIPMLIYGSRVLNETMEVEFINVVDLTATFGAGNEPTNEKCVEIFANYFNDTKSTFSASRLKSVGKNLFDGKIEKGAYSNTTGSKSIADNYVCCDKPIKVLPNKEYIISADIKNTTIIDVHIQFWNNSTFIGSNLSGTTLMKYSFSTPINCTHITFNIPKTGIVPSDVLWLQIEPGTVATPYEPYTESTQYIQAKDSQGKIVELRSLPNGTKDEVRVSEGKLIKRVSDTVITTGNVITFNTTLASEIDIVYTNIKLFTNAGVMLRFVDGKTISQYKDWQKRIPNTYYVDSASTCLRFNVPKGQFANLDEAKAYFDSATLTYQLAEPEIIPIEASRNIVAHPNGTVYIEHGTFTAGVYGVNGIAVTNTGLPIKTINKITKIDYTTGLEYDLDISQAVISEDKLLFTHPDLTAGDIVFFDYNYDVESTEGLATVEFYDSRYVIEDKSIAGKYYTWKVEVDNGVPSITVVEV